MRKSVRKLESAHTKSSISFLSGVVVVKVLLVSTFLLVSSQAFSVGDVLAYKKAQETVEKYRELRKVCTISQDEQRRDCFAELDDSTEDYQKAKKVLGLQKSHDETQLLGQVE